ncbi:MAG: RDD family protein [Planctomycetota bacterium]
MVDASLGNGVFFQQSDYGGLVRRCLAMLIDSIVLYVTAMVIWAVLVMLLWDPQTGWVPYPLFLALWGAVAWVYLTVVKRSRWRTIGYRLTGLRIVSLTGGHPSLAAMTIRFLLSTFGPFSVFLDLIWLSADAEQ